MRAACDRNPDAPQSHVQLGVLLWRAGLVQEAERTLTAAVQRFPSSLPTAIEHAKLPMWNGDCGEALRRWRRVREQFPDDAVAWSGSAAALLDGGQPEEAEAMLSDATIRFPDSSDIAIWRGTVAARRGQWAEAERRYAAAAAAFPTHTGIRLARQKLNYQSTLRRQSHAQHGESSSSRPGAGAFEDVGDFRPSGRAAVLARYQSLGEHCEFGNVQRRFGVEPMDLFRFARIASTRVLKMLETGCGGIGDPKTTSVFARRHTGEYFVTDTKLKISWHTGEFECATTEEQLLAREYRRLSYLARRFEQDLQRAARIFVHVSDAPLDFTSCESLARAVHQRSPHAVVLCVGFAASMDQPRVTWGGPGLLLAERTAMLLTWRWPDDETAPPYQQWLDICAAAIELVEGHRAANCRI